MNETSSTFQTVESPVENESNDSCLVRNIPNPFTLSGDPPPSRFKIAEPSHPKEMKFIPPLKIDRVVKKRNITKKSKKRPKKLWAQFGDTETTYCRICGSIDSPQWRKGPDHKISLCNACGLHYLANIKSEKKIPPNPNPLPIPISFILN